jgi:carboxyvinyl-carboxyphosphonate phosphorylmutase
MKVRTRLRELLAGNQIVVAPGAHDALTARIIAKTGFPVVYMTGYGQSASHLGYPDVGLMTQTEMATRAANFVDLLIPECVGVFADGDTGFGNAINVMRTIRMYERAGVAAIQLEDQVAPKKCGHMTGRQVVPAEEMVGKIKAAVAAREDPEMVIVARTDARTVHGIDEAIRRGKLYADAGADVLFIESPESVEEMRLIVSSFDKPCLANMVEGGRTPLLTAQELQEIGFRIVIFPTASTYATCKAMFSLMNGLKVQGGTAGLMQDMVTFEEFNNLIGLPQIRSLEATYVK